MFMAAENFYIERSDHKHKVFGIVGTTVVHAGLFVLLFFIVLYPPDPPWESQGKGIMMSLGDENMGGPKINPVPEPQPKEQYVPITEQADEQPVTSDDDESVAIKKTEKPVEKKNKNPVKEEIKKPHLDLPRKPDDRALFTKKTGRNEAGRGDGDEPGNQGMPDGSLNGDPHGQGLGDEGTGLGKTGD